MGTCAGLRGSLRPVALVAPRRDCGDPRRHFCAAAPVAHRADCAYGTRLHPRRARAGYGGASRRGMRLAEGTSMRRSGRRQREPWGRAAVEYGVDAVVGGKAWVNFLYFWLLDQGMLSADTLNAHRVSASGKVPQERRRRCWSHLVHTLSTSMARV